MSGGCASAEMQTLSSASGGAIRRIPRRPTADEAPRDDTPAGEAPREPSRGGRPPVTGRAYQGARVTSAAAGLAWTGRRSGPGGACRRRARRPSIGSPPTTRTMPVASGGGSGTLGAATTSSPRSSSTRRLGQRPAPGPQREQERERLAGADGHRLAEARVELHALVQQRPGSREGAAARRGRRPPGCPGAARGGRWAGTTSASGARPSMRAWRVPGDDLDRVAARRQQRRRARSSTRPRFTSATFDFGQSSA